MKRKLAFAGWSAIVCPSCRAEMHRAPYRKPCDPTPEGA